MSIVAIRPYTLNTNKGFYGTKSEGVECGLKHLCAQDSSCNVLNQIYYPYEINHTNKEVNLKQISFLYDIALAKADRDIERAKSFDVSKKEIDNMKLARSVIQIGHDSIKSICITWNNRLGVSCGFRTIWKRRNS